MAESESTESKVAEASTQSSKQIQGGTHCTHKGIQSIQHSGVFLCILYIFISTYIPFLPGILKGWFVFFVRCSEKKSFCW